MKDDAYIDAAYLLLGRAILAAEEFTPRETESHKLQKRIRAIMDYNTNWKPKEATKMKETARTEWDTKQLQEDFTVQSFLAPIVFVTRKKDGVSGTMDFTHSPRVYFNWRASNE